MAMVNMTIEPATTPKAPKPQRAQAVVVHSGARDAYQVACALEQSGQLSSLVTDVFWKEGSRSARLINGLLPVSARRSLQQRAAPALANARIQQLPVPGVVTLALERVKAPRALRRSMMRFLDRSLGRAAGRQAKRADAALVSYSYYAYDAFRAAGRPGILFQLHPHPASMRRLLSEELAAHPECASSLRQEWELALPEGDFRRLCAEPDIADKILVASSFTRKTLEENGVAPGKIRVIPYGVDTSRFRPDVALSGRRRSNKLQLLFVGRINQRKGISYLLEALRLLGSAPVELTICGRVVDDLSLFRAYADRITIRPSVSESELQAAYQQADLFVFPSVAEGFGQVLLEALASGLPILSTTHTAAPDLIESGRQGFVIEPRRPDLIADRLEWALSHGEQLAAMRKEARVKAEEFTWSRFRATVAGQCAEWLGSGRHSIKSISEVANAL